MPTGKPTKSRLCVLCNKVFVPRTPATKICDDTHFSSCPICGKSIVWNSTRSVEPCSKECRKEQTRRNYIIKYGVDHPMKNKDVQQRHKAAMKQKYGVEHALQLETFKSKASQTIQARLGVAWAQSSNEVKAKSFQTMIERYGGKTTLESPVLKAKMRDTMIERYGESNPSRVDELRAKAQATNIERWGVINPMMDPSIAQKSKTTRYNNIDAITDKIKATLMEKYGVDNPAKIPEVRAKISDALRTAYPNFKDKMIDTNISKYGVPYYCMTEECRALQGSTISSINKRFGAKLDELHISHSYEYPVSTYSYDIKVDDSLLEIDPSYTHNVIGNHWGQPVSFDYHLRKTQAANDAGYRCIHIFDWDDWNKVINLVKPVERRIYARKCDIYKIHPNVGDKFLNENHIQGTCRGQLLYLGLVHEGELVQIMTFGRPRYDRSYDVELLRLCTLSGAQVVGGASRLFHHAVSTYELHNIISYCDRSKFLGKVYEAIGMHLNHVSPPQEIWSKGNKHITANLLRSRGYDQLFHTDYGKGTDNEQLMLENGWLPIYDCGQLVYEFR